MDLRLSEDNKTILLSSSDNLHIIKGVAFKNYKVICEYQRELLTILLEANGQVGTILENEKSSNLIKKINKLLNLDKETINSIEELDLDQYFSLYFTQNTKQDELGRKVLVSTENNNTVLDISPSLISVINGVDFFSQVSKALEIIKNQMQETN